VRKLRNVLTLLVVVAAAITLVLRQRADAPSVGSHSASLIVAVIGLIILAGRIGFTVLDVKSHLPCAWP
jgi:prolipoprotein diacylglyceryltransferase